MGRPAPIILAVALLVLSAVGPQIAPELTSDVTGAGTIDVGVDRQESTPDPEVMLKGLRGYFIENRGQIANGDVRFYAGGAQISVGLTPRSAMFSLKRSWGHPAQTPGAVLDSTSLERCSFDLVFEGCNDVEPQGARPQRYTENYFLGSDPARWVQSARSYCEVLYEDIYDGIDLRFYFKDGALKYDYILDGGADAAAILHRYNGVQGLEIDRVTGDLLVSTPVGTFRDTRPVVFQECVEGGRGLPAAFTIIDGTGCGFVLSDEVKCGLPFVIDPGLIFSTYYCGVYDDYVGALVVDGHDDIYIAGSTNSYDFPATPGCFDGIGNVSTGFPDGFIAKFTASGSPISATFIGGSYEEWLSALAIGESGDVFALGTTNSSDFPTAGIDPDGYHGGYDLFLLRFNDALSRLYYSGLFGGTHDELANELDIGSDGGLYVCAGTYSADVNTTAGAFCETYEGTGAYLDAGLSMVLTPEMEVRYCSYINGLHRIYMSPTRLWDALAISQAIDGSGAVYLTSATASRDFPVTIGAQSTVHGGGATDAFVMLLDPRGSGRSDLLSSTFVGGDGYEFPMDMELDESGNVYLTGWTTSWDLPLTPNAFIKSKRCEQSGFIISLDATLETLVYGSYYGGDNQEWTTDIEIGPTPGMVTLMGTTVSRYLPTTPGCFDPKFRGMPAGEYLYSNWYIAVLDLNGATVEYATYFGGSGSCYQTIGGDTLFIDSNGEIVLTIAVDSIDYPTTEGAYCRTGAGELDVLVARLDPRACGLPDPPNATVRSGDRSAYVSWTPHSMIGYRVLEYRLYDLGDPVNPLLVKTIPAEVSEALIDGLENGRRYTLGLSAVNSMGEGPTRNLTVRPVGPPTEPTGLVAKTGDGRVTLTWGGPLDEGGGDILCYHVFRGPGLAELEPINETVSCNFTDDTVEPGMFYLYKVSACNEAGDGTGAFVTVMVQTRPAPPTGLRADPGDGFVRLAWGPPHSDGGASIQGYRLYRGESDDDFSLLQELDRAPFEFSDKGLSNGKTYHYRISSRNMHGESDVSEVVNATPYGPSGPPRELEVRTGDASAQLTWRPPQNDNGRPVSGYRVYIGESLATLRFIINTNLTQTSLSGLQNGKEYYFQVAAINAWGVSPEWSNIANATPYGRPDEVNSVSLLSEGEGIVLRWASPTVTGGADHLNYVILRGESAISLDVVCSITDAFEWLDTSVTTGRTYWYSMRATNTLWEGPDLAPRNITYITIPGRVGGVNALAGDSRVDISWSRPEEDGGVPFILYTILRRTQEGGEAIEVYETELLVYTDTSVQNGMAYYYAVRARNTKGSGPISESINATPLGQPLPPSLKMKVSGTRVVLTWQTIQTEGTLPITGFIVFRGTSMWDMGPIATIGIEERYLDSDVQAGATYYYKLVPRTERGEVPVTEYVVVKIPLPPDWSWLPKLIVILVVGTVTGYFLMRRRSMLLDRKVSVIPSVESRPVIAELGPDGAARFIVEEIFVIHRNGKLISSCSRQGCKTDDADLLTGMLIAVQGIVQDGLHSGGELESIRYGENEILLASGRNVSVAVTVYGVPDELLIDDIETMVQRIETAYAGVLDDWMGAPRELAGLEELILPIIKRTEDVPRQSVRSVSTSPTVSLVSAVDFHRGYVRLKVLVVNATGQLVADAAMQVEYAPDMLRLESVEPSTLRLRGDRVALGNIKPGERSSVSFMFDPQICQGTQIDGLLTYFDGEGVRQRVEMRRRHVDVVCPIFFTKEHANTAMLRRLIKESLPMSDMRAQRYPQEIPPSEVLELGKQAIGGRGIQLVREYVVDGPPYEAEVWYYGETKVKEHQMVIRLSVIEEKQVIELFVTADTMEPITGLLAEFRREFVKALKEQSGDRSRMDLRIDEGLREELRTREPLIERLDDTVDDKEVPG